MTEVTRSKSNENVIFTKESLRQLILVTSPKRKNVWQKLTYFRTPFFPFIAELRLQLSGNFLFRLERGREQIKWKKKKDREDAYEQEEQKVGYDRDVKEEMRGRESEKEFSRNIKSQKRKRKKMKSKNPKDTKKIRNVDCEGVRRENRSTK